MLQDKACRCNGSDDVTRIRSMQKALWESYFIRKGVADLFGIDDDKHFAAGLMYVKPVVAGTDCPGPLSTPDLVKMFLLGFCESRTVLESVLGDI